MPPPTLCDVFQMLNVSPRSDSLNQWPITRPHGGQPMPCTKPLSAHSMRWTL